MEALIAPIHFDFTSIIGEVASYAANSHAKETWLFHQTTDTLEKSISAIGINNDNKDKAAILKATIIASTQRVIDGKKRIADVNDEFIYSTELKM